MNINRWSLFWGIILIGGGALALADQLGYIEAVSPTIWVFVFAAISLFAFFGYAASGWKQWAWLFPAGICAGLAVTVALAANNVNSAAVGSPLFFGLLIPFAGAYLTDRARNWWALIPGGIMLFLALTTLMVESTGGEWVGALLMLMFALAFLAVYFNNRARTWALLVAYIFGVLSIAPMLAAGDDTAAYFGSVFFFAIALPFFVVYFRSPEQNWWAIIPAGVMTVIGIVAALAIAGLINDTTSGGYVNAFFMAGLAATFSVLWLRHHKAWARVVTIVLGLVAVASVFFFSYYEIFWPVVFILGGVYLLYLALRPRAA